MQVCALYQVLITNQATNPVTLKGQIKTSNYENEYGENKKLTQIIAEKVTFLSSNKNLAN